MENGLRQKTQAVSVEVQGLEPWTDGLKDPWETDAGACFSRGFSRSPRLCPTLVALMVALARSHQTRPGAGGLRPGGVSLTERVSGAGCRPGPAAPAGPRR